MATTKKSAKHICSECLSELDQKDLFVAHVPNPDDVPNRDYNTIYCDKCIEKLKIEEFKPYAKGRKVKEKVEKTDKPVKKTTIKKPTVKKPTTKKVTKK